MFTEKLCQLCNTEESELVCFCKKIVLCSSCIGKHLISDPSGQHKPVPLSQSHLTSVLAVNFEKVKAEESQIIADLSQKHSINIEIQQKFEKELKIIDDFQSLSIQLITESVKIIESDLLAFADELTQRVVNQCGIVKSKLQNELNEIKKGNFDFDELTKYLSELTTSEEVEKYQLINKNADFIDFNLKNLIEKYFVFDIDINPIGMSRPESPLIQTSNKKYHISLSITDNDIDEPSIPAPQSTKSKIGRIPSFIGSKTPTAKINRSPPRFRRNSKVENLLPNSTLSSFEQESLDFGSDQTISPISSVNASFSDFATNIPKITKMKSSNDIEALGSTKFKLPALLFYLIPEIQAVATYNPASDEIDKMPIVKKEACLEGAAWTVVSNNLLYITGGYQSAAKKTAWIYNITTSELSIGPSMKTARHSHAMVCLNDIIYVFGGQGSNSLRECEKLVMSSKSWQSLSNLTVPRASPSACVYKGYIYIGGGQSHDSIEKYSYLNNVFTMLKIKLPTVGKCLLVYTHDQIIIFQNKLALFIDPVKGVIKNSVEIPEDDWWSPGNSLALGRSIYFVTKYIVYRFDLDLKDIFPLADLHRKVN
ncbi:unnamed protein product [Blepharisma stoltei]|uniref:B box-type domain-containing protein n=1 Tax=Blepharisma stoltei TaxID=1481888 RepID=A0AAU9K5R9_9CILI|nr:unnamed protein product [Blepharisma stoltei]